MNIQLNTVAECLQVHPRTVLRAIEGETNVYWAPKYDPEVTLVDVCNAYNIDEKTLKKALKDPHPMMTAQQAAEHFGVPIRTFRYRKYPVSAQRGNIVRYYLPVISKYHVEKYL